MFGNVPMVRAGDVLLVCFAAEQPADTAQAFADQVHKYLPGVKVAFMEGVTGLAVFRPDADDADM
ncbi:hypothetical protein EASAB2608_06204 [Streptomyces sp. EAS-AB2608]|uniref:hypothetical protein n=1 Tax=Streptomyces sp. EAS-AB2608 TaxID=2779671 RepID=UPI001BF10AC4|nr:hypothetical protein [Streptomyces sp. EAS-AB2608]BCM70870.1 hypothetical protein EASAB2608_06204 [Streptomyces sp. EAS-AB2608]